MSERDECAPDSPCLTARQAAAYLHLNEKKLYQLANSAELPAARVGGKWLFPRALLDEWLLEQAHGGILTDRLLIAGSADPLLAAAIASLAPDLNAEGLIAGSPTDVHVGLEQLARRRATICTLAWGDVEHSSAQHARLLRAFPAHARWTRVRVALREQGVVMRPGLGLAGLETLAAFDVRWAMRSAASSSGHFIASRLAAAGLRDRDCRVVAHAHSADLAAALIVRDEADCMPGTRALATAYGLEFLPLGWEALDLVMAKEVFFRRLFQQLLARLESDFIVALSSRLGGYDLSPLGRVQADG